MAASAGPRRPDPRVLAGQLPLGGWEAVSLAAIDRAGMPSMIEVWDCHVLLQAADAAAVKSVSKGGKPVDGVTLESDEPPDDVGSTVL
jgi:hypothetical protein